MDVNPEILNLISFLKSDTLILFLFNAPEQTDIFVLSSIIDDSNSRELA